MVKLFFSLLFCFVFTAHAADLDVGPGIASNQVYAGNKTLNRIIAETAGRTVTIIISEPVSIPYANLIVPPNVTLEFTGDGRISCGSFTLTIQSSTANWPSRQIFASDCSSTGSVSFAGNQFSGSTRTEWWGAFADGATSVPALQAAVNASLNRTLLLAPGIYAWDHAASAITLPSHTHLSGSGTVITSTTTGAGPGIFKTKTTSTTGSISASTNSLFVAANTDIEVGSLIAIKAAQGGTSGQRTTLNSGLDNVSSTISVVSTSGYVATLPLLIETEMVSCTAKTSTTWTGCTRGAFGTTAASHITGTNVDAATDFISEVTAVNGTSITLADNASFTVSAAPVTIGAISILLDGDILIDGSQNRGGSDPTNNQHGLFAILGRWLIVGDGVTFQNLDHAGINCWACRDSLFGGLYVDIGRPADVLGFDIILFGRSLRNAVRSRGHRGGNVAVMIDDRSTSLDSYDGTPLYNFATVGPITSQNSGVQIQCGSYNTIYASTIETSGIAIAINCIQWTTSPVPTENVIMAGRAAGGQSISIDSSAINGGNYLSALVAPNAITTSAGNIVVAGTATGGLRATAFDFVDATNARWYVAGSNDIRLKVNNGDILRILTTGLVVNQSGQIVVGSSGVGGTFTGFNYSGTAGVANWVGYRRDVPTDTPVTCASGITGTQYYDLSLNKACQCNGTTWCLMENFATCGTSTSCG